MTNEDKGAAMEHEEAAAAAAAAATSLESILIQMIQDYQGQLRSLLLQAVCVTARGDRPARTCATGSPTLLLYSHACAPFAPPGLCTHSRHAQTSIHPSSTNSTARKQASPRSSSHASSPGTAPSSFEALDTPCRSPPCSDGRPQSTSSGSSEARSSSASQPLPRGMRTRLLTACSSSQLVRD